MNMMNLLHKEMMILMVGKTSVQKNFSPETAAEVLRITMMVQEEDLLTSEAEAVVVSVWAGVVGAEAPRP